MASVPVSSEAKRVPGDLVCFVFLIRFYLFRMDMLRRGPPLPELELSDAERDPASAVGTSPEVGAGSDVAFEDCAGVFLRVSNSEVSRRLEVSLPTVRKWRTRFLEHGV